MKQKIVDYRLKENQKYKCDKCQKIVSGLVCKPLHPIYDGFYCDGCFKELGIEKN